MDYNRGKGALKNWLVTEPVFDILHQGKCEAILSLGNGYLGIRSATEETARSNRRFAMAVNPLLAPQISRGSSHRG